MAAKDELGKRGEDVALSYLCAAGYRLVDRNWRCAQGEIDLIVAQGGEVVFVEVKTRSSVKFGHPFEAITATKLARLRRLAAAWCAQADSPPRLIRIDAVAIVAAAGADPVIEHRQGLF
jgi:putative endonuclease